jgi:hypothetical protein
LKDSYLKLGIALAISLVLMFVLTMSMVRTIDHFYLNLSNFYMALIMVAPMGVVMLVVMWGMFKDKRLNYLLLAGFTALFVAAFWMGRAETFEYTFEQSGEILAGCHEPGHYEAGMVTSMTVAGQ